MEERQMMFNFVIEHLIEYWGRSSVALQVMQTLRDLGEDLSEASRSHEIADAIRRHPDEVLELLNNMPGEMDAINAASMQEGTMKKKEQMLCEALDTFLSHKAELGLQEQDWEEESHTFQFLHEQINEMFALKAAGMNHNTGICSAFRKVHNYKYITDPTFNEAMRKELTGQAIPGDERDKALGFINKIIEEIKKEEGTWDERDAGFNPNLDEIIKVSNPGQE
jgi:hypothetical protein